MRSTCARSIYAAKSSKPQTKARRALDRSTSHAAVSAASSALLSPEDLAFVDTVQFAGSHEAFIGSEGLRLEDIEWIKRADDLDEIEREDARRWRAEALEEASPEGPIVSDEYAHFHFDEHVPLASAIPTARQSAPNKATRKPRPERDTVVPVVEQASSLEQELKLFPPSRSLLPLRDPHCEIFPYIPSPPPVHGPPQPHHFQLLSRYDWRLSSPLARRRANLLEPPPLSYFPRGGNTLLGYNKLVGVGREPAAEATRQDLLGISDRWGWKLPVPETTRGSWADLTTWSRRPHRLIELSRLEDELRYNQTLKRQGTPKERQNLGITLLGAVGRVIRKDGGIATTSEAVKAVDKDVEKSVVKSLQDENVGRSPRIYSLWTLEDGRAIGPKDSGAAFSAGKFVRFTSLSAKPTGPQPPMHLQERPPQGTVTDIKEGGLIVSFDEMWDFDDGLWQLDLGYDDSAYNIQQKAIDNLYYDSSDQRQHNKEEIYIQQQKNLSGLGSATPTEWALQGTEIRKLLVPDSEMQQGYKSVQAALDEEAESDKPPSILAARQSIDLPDSTPGPTNPSTLFMDNQLIRSWVRRYERENPLKMVGDPELGLNESQTRAVAMALGESLSLIQGPPGTGKSQTIVSIIHLLKAHFRVPAPILLCAPTHVSIDHLLSLLVSKGLNPLRLGRPERVRNELAQWTVQARREDHPLFGRTEAIRETLVELKKQMDVYSGKTLEPTGAKALALIKDSYRRGWRKLFTLEKRLYSSLFATADVFCSTALGTSSTRVLDMIDFPIVFVDEAAMCTEPITLVPMMKGAAHVALIGDHMQLPAVVTSMVARAEGLHVSTFERLMAQKSVKTVLLETQYRMRPCISAFPNAAFYSSALNDSTSVSTRPNPPLSKYFQHTLLPGSNQTTFEPAVFLSHNFPESRLHSSSINTGEVDVIVKIVGDLLQRNPTLETEDIGIISAYAAQTSLLRKTFDYRAGESLIPLLGSHRASEVSRVEINTVDGFQGREKSIIIFSTVRSNPRGVIGFLTDKRRLNVALTRAQNGLFVVGNERTLRLATTSEWAPSGDLRDNDAGIFRAYLNWMKSRSLIRHWEELEPVPGNASLEESTTGR